MYGVGVALVGAAFWVGRVCSLASTWSGVAPALAGGQFNCASPAMSHDLVGRRGRAGEGRGGERGALHDPTVFTIVEGRLHESAGTTYNASNRHST